MHEFDLAARVASTDDFWVSLTRDFRARFIVFEFKNYKKPISQREVYTTEKYLYPLAMRSTAIIIARNGYDAGALKAAEGALRESGKVILMFSAKEICDMLKAKDKLGDAALNLLAEKFHKMLLSLER